MLSLRGLVGGSGRVDAKLAHLNTPSCSWRQDAYENGPRSGDAYVISGLLDSTHHGQPAKEGAGSPPIGAPELVDKELHMTCINIRFQSFSTA